MYNNYPWYFKNNNVVKAWEYSQGTGIVIHLVDTCIDFSRPSLQGKSFLKVQECDTHFNFPAYKIHGTAMAGLISANASTLSCNNCKNDLIISVAGIYS